MLRRYPRAPRLILSLVLTALTVSAAAAFAAISPDAGRNPARLVSPAPGEQVVESAARFAFDLPRDLTDARLVISRRAFDPSGWTEIPTDQELIVASAALASRSLEAAGVAIDSDTPLWWAVAARDPRTGALRVSEVRSFTALRKFANRVAPSPYLLTSTRGVMTREEMASQKAVHGTLAAGSTMPRMRLGAGYEFTLGDRTRPELPAELSARTPREENADAIQSFLVQFPEAPSRDDVDAITRAGGAVFTYIPDQAFLVRMSDKARAQLESGTKLVWVDRFEPAYKVSPMVDRSTPGPVSFTALLFPDADPSATRAALIGMGASDIVESNNGINRLLRFTLDGALVASAVGIDAVAWLEPSPRFELQNSNAQWVVQTGSNGNRKIWDQGIRGQGQIVMTSDSGINTNHNQFRDPALTLTGFGDSPTHRKIIAYKNGSLNPGVTFGDHAGASYHGTHTAGTIAGSDDPVAADLRDGMAKDAKIYFMDISGTTLANSVDPLPDLNDLFLPSYIGNAGGTAHISSNSWGSAASGAYTLNSMQVDQFMWAHPDYLIVFSNGNAGGVQTVGSPASAKNSAGAGGTQNGVSQANIYSSTSRGPTFDGRRKPTWCSPGQTVQSALGSGTTGYQSLSGTSMASPSGAGAVTLMRQYLTDGWYPTGAPVPANGFSPSAALLKAMGVNAAENLMTAFNAPDNNIGFGRLLADSVLYFAGDGRKLLIVDNTEGLAQAEYIEYQVNVVDASRALEISMCWTDFPGSPTAVIQLVNNLNLTVSKGPTVYKGNVFTAGSSVTGGAYDGLNVEENVRIAVPTAGIYTVRVDAPTVPMGPQPFALVITGGVGSGAGALAMDRATYGSSDTIELQVIDDNAVGSVTVDIQSTTESTPETVTLTGGSGVYSGTFAVSDILTVNGDNTLSVSSGDLITATYNDAAPATTLIAQANVTFDTPVITNVKATALSATSTRITWTTDRNASSRVLWGSSPALGATTDSSGYSLSHAVVLSGLTSAADYYYDVQSVSLQGGSATDDLGGAHHKFTTKTKGDVLVVYGDPSYPRAETWNNALNALGWNFDTAIIDAVTTPALGDLATGLRSYRAVLWQIQPDAYPPLSDPQRAVIDSLIAGGGRFAITGHDIGWGLGDPASPGFTAPRAAWLSTGLHANYISDPSNWVTNTGIAADPISGDYTGGIPYQATGAGQAGDEMGIVPGAGTSAHTWRNDFAPVGNIGSRWESLGPLGDAGSAQWGGQPSRIANMFFEWTGMAPPSTVPDAQRHGVLDKTILYLLGRARPTVAISTPNGGENVTTATLDITWSESVAGGLNVGARTIEYSLDDGDSWTTLTTSPGASPYNWDLSSVPNSSLARVRVSVTDDGTPTLSSSDVSNATFAINRDGGDTQGPVVVAGSIESTPNPIIRGNAATLTARITEQFTGAGVVDSAEWSIGASPAAAGAGTPMTGVFGTATVNVSVILDTNPFFTGVKNLWVRGRDSNGVWGPAATLAVRINGTDPVGVGDLQAISFLAPTAPNPFAGRTSIRFGLANPGRVDLGVFDTQGRRVRTLVSAASMAPGVHVSTWDGVDAVGARVKPGVYYVRLITDAGEFQKRTVMVQ